MKFGSDEIFSLIGNNIDKADSSALYETLYEVVRADTLLMISKYRISKENQDDIVQEVQIAVFTHLIAFYESNKSSTEQQRNAWLSTIIRSKCIDYFRFVSKNLSKDIPYDDALDVISSMPAVEDLLTLREELFGVIKAICSFQTTPNKILAFFLLKMSCAETGDRKNGSPKDISNEFSGWKLCDVLAETRRRLESFFECEIPTEVFSALQAKVDSADIPTFELSARTITDSSNWIGSKVKQSSERNG